MGKRPDRQAKRRTDREISEIREAILEILVGQHPATCRGLFYALVTRGLVAKTEVEYKSTVVRLASDMRRNGRLPYHWLADSTRWMRKPASWDSLDDALEETARLYRRALWQQQDSYVEVWLEKDALAGVVYEVTERWDVPLMPTRGYASLSFLHAAAEVIGHQGKPAFIYYLGDYDPSGMDIPRVVRRELARLAPNVDITFRRLAVNADQVRAMRLPTRPTKQSDSRAAAFGGSKSVELDAIPAPRLRQIVESAIVSHIDDDRLESLLEVEHAEKETLATIRLQFGRSA